jgi:dolichyl-phosphate beta-glucosyltransferase
MVLFTDIDLSVPLPHAEALIEKVEEGYDVAIGSRRVSGAVIEVHQPPFREFLGKGYRRIANLILGTDFSDHTCGMKAFKGEAAQALFGRQILERWAFDSEILYLCKKLGYRVAEVPVHWRDASGTKVRKFRDVITSFVEVLTIRFHHG